MRIIKVSLLLMIFSIASNFIITNAAIVNGSGIIGGVDTIKVGKTVTSSAFKKELYVAQSIKNTNTYTTITNPCNDCKIKSELLYKKSDGKFGSLGSTYTYMNQKGIFANTTIASAPGTFKIKNSRNGITAVTTYFAYDWCIDNTCN